MGDSTAILSDGLAAAFRSWSLLDLPAPAPSLPGNGHAAGAVVFGDSYVAVGTVGIQCCAEGDPSVNRGVVWTSRDGQTWTTEQTNDTFLHATLAGIAEVGSQLVAFGSFAAPKAGDTGTSIGASWASRDGITWTRASDPAPSIVVAGPHGFVGAIVSPESDPSPSFRFVSSPDGRAWTTASSDFRADLRAMAVDGSGGVLAVGDVAGAPLADGSPTADLLIWRSTDGLSWPDPESIVHAAIPLGLAGSLGRGSYALVMVEAGGRVPGTQVWRMPTAGGAAVVASAPADGTLTAVFVAGDALFLSGSLGTAAGEAQTAIWVSTDGGRSFGRIPNQPTLGQGEIAIDALVGTNTGLIALGSRSQGTAYDRVPVAWLVAR